MPGMWDVRIPHDATEQEALKLAYVAGLNAGILALRAEILRVAREFSVESIDLERLTFTREELRTMEVVTPPEARAWESYRELYPNDPENEVPVEELNLNVRVYNILKREGFHTIGDLPTWEILERIEGFGTHSQNVLIECLRVRDVTLVVNSSM